MTTFSMEIKLKIIRKSVQNYIIFILCWKCIVLCWWVWRVSATVSRDLQTRKTVQITWWFRQFHYNRDPYTNGHPQLFIISDPLWISTQCPTFRIDCETNFLSILENFFSKCLYFLWKAPFCHPFVTIPLYVKKPKVFVEHGRNPAICHIRSRWSSHMYVLWRERSPGMP